MWLVVNEPELIVSSSDDTNSNLTLVQRCSASGIIKLSTGSVGTAVEEHKGLCYTWMVTIRDRPTLPRSEFSQVCTAYVVTVMPSGCILDPGGIYYTPTRRVSCNERRDPGIGIKQLLLHSCMRSPWLAFQVGESSSNSLTTNVHPTTVSTIITIIPIPYSYSIV